MIFFLIFAQNIDCGYTLEPNRLNVLEQKKKKERKNVYPCKPQFYYIKVGCAGYKLYGRVIMTTDSISLGRPEIFEKKCQNRGGGAYLAVTSLQIDSPLKF